jgi:hypothetical protein
MARAVGPEAFGLWGFDRVVRGKGVGSQGWGEAIIAGVRDQTALGVKYNSAAFFS